MLCLSSGLEVLCAMLHVVMDLVRNVAFSVCLLYDPGCLW